MKTRHPILIAFFLASFSLTVTAQQSVIASGNNATGSGGSSSYSIGQIIYISSHGTNGNITQGLQQPYEISTLGIDELPEMNLQFLAYPNPTNDFLTLSIENYRTDNMRYQLFEISGKTLKNNKLTASRTDIDMTNYESGLYFLKIIENNREIKTFKIIKK